MSKHEPHRPDVVAVPVGTPWSRACPGGRCSNAKAPFDFVAIEGHAFTMGQLAEILAPLGWTVVERPENRGIKCAWCGEKITEPGPLSVYADEFCSKHCAYNKLREEIERT